jgi:hypothetical protein
MTVNPLTKPRERDRYVVCDQLLDLDAVTAVEGDRATQ